MVKTFQIRRYRDGTGHYYNLFLRVQRMPSRNGQRSATVRRFGIAGQEAIMDELANPRMITRGDNRWL